MAGPSTHPTRFAHANGAIVVVPARVAAWLDRRLNLRRLRTEHRGNDAEVDAVLIALGIAAAAWRANLTGSDTGTRVDVQSEPVASSLVMTTSEAAQALDIGPRAVTKAIAEGRLEASRAGNQWLIDRESIEHFRASRRQRAC